MASSHAPPLLEVRGVRKSFGGVRALRGVDLSVSRPGAVHALIGENGSGKSTLLSILSGQIQPDDGEIAIDGSPVVLGGAAAGVQRGIAMVSQETAVAGDLSVAENVLLGRLPRRRGGAIDWRGVHAQAAEVIARLGLASPTTALVRDLPPDQRQLVEIARALSMNPRVLILDEPTSTLTGDEVELVLQAIHGLKRHNVATILVSHRLQELLSVADEITILRDGAAVAAGPISGFPADRIVSAMLGTEEGVAVSAPRRSARRDEAATLAVVDGCGRGFADVSFDVYPGEVVGLAGLVGSGRSELLRTLFGLAPLEAGTVRVAGVPYVPRNPGHAIRAGLGYVPPERKTEGLVLQMTARENVAMAATATARWTPRHRRGSAFATYEVLARRMRVREDAADAAAGTLSGGNQQKLVLAKWLAIQPAVLMLEEPTRGVDVGARGQIHEMLRELAAGGASIVVSSAENPELLELCDRIFVLFGGRTIGECRPDKIDEAGFAALTGGQHTNGGSP